MRVNALSKTTLSKDCHNHEKMTLNKDFTWQSHTNHTLNRDYILYNPQIFVLKRRIIEKDQDLIPLTGANVSIMVNLTPLTRARVVLVIAVKNTLIPCFCSHACLQLLYMSDPPGDGRVV
jgi:hypothetical protein